MDKFNLNRLTAKLDTMPVALSLADLAVPDQPLIYVNSAFCDLTGYDRDVVGRNCRFLQAELTNTEARAEIRHALLHNKQAQVALHNRRKDGTQFYNLLLLHQFEKKPSGLHLSLGAQFDLGSVDPQLAEMEQKPAGDPEMQFHLKRLERIKTERRRLVSDTAIRIVSAHLAVMD
ncbi:MAG: PAS domain-containing protein [Pseudomonadota bacterium]